MKISELLRRLERLRETRGDLEVRVGTRSGTLSLDAVAFASTRYRDGERVVATPEVAALLSVE